MPEERAFNPENKFVRVTELRKDGFVEFEFAIGEPELFCEMLMPATAFDEFCRLNRVMFLDPHRPRDEGAEQDGAESADAPWNWTLYDATHQRFKSDRGGQGS
jgi:phenol/toluene 2-monooxygenase (NADH) P0/A0